MTLFWLSNDLWKFYGLVTTLPDSRPVLGLKFICSLGLEVLRAMEQVGSQSGKVGRPVIIEDCGQL